MWDYGYQTKVSKLLSTYFLSTPIRELGHELCSLTNQILVYNIFVVLIFSFCLEAKFSANVVRNHFMRDSETF